MTNNELLNLILSDSTRIATAITTGAQWEVWMQVELAVLLSESGFKVAREVLYPPPFDNLILDLLVQDQQGSRYAIELKAESATNAGQAAGRPIMTALESDVAKIGYYRTESLAARWVVGIAYSDFSKNKFKDFVARYPKAAIYGDENGVGVMIIDADAFSALSK